jgi:hypothetical protein
MARASPLPLFVLLTDTVVTFVPPDVMPSATAQLPRHAGDKIIVTHGPPTHLKCEPCEMPYTKLYCAAHNSRIYIVF